MRGTRLQPAVQRDEGSACRAMGHQEIVRGAGVQPAVPSLILIGWEGGIVINTIVIYGTKKAKPYTEYRQPTNSEPFPRIRTIYPHPHACSPSSPPSSSTLAFTFSLLWDLLIKARFSTELEPATFILRFLFCFSYMAQALTRTQS